MKKLKFRGTLKLNKEVISKLQDNQMLDVKGGQAMLALGACSKGPACSCTSHSCTVAVAGVAGVAIGR